MVKITRITSGNCSKKNTDENMFNILFEERCECV